MIRLILLLSMLPISASAQILAECGPSKGYSYDLPTAFSSSGEPLLESAWEEDGFSRGKIILIKTPSGVDIDDTANGVGKTFTSFGASVQLLSTSSVGIIVGVFHPEYVNTYYFNYSSNKLTWTRQNNSPSRPLAGAFVSDCIFQ